MAARSVITLTMGPAGSGKTYVRCARFLIDYWLPDRDGVHYSNFPVFKDKVAECAARRINKPASELADRIQIIPEDVLKSWVSGMSGPWDYFANTNLDGCHIAIDECHNFCGAKTNHKIRARWQAWLGEIRHQGATVEFLSQSPEKVAREIHYEAGLRLSLVNSEDRRDPFFGILMGDWYELRAGFITGEYETTVWEIERRNVDGKWIEQHKRVFILDPFYFQFYDSFSTPVQGGHKAAGQQRECQRRTKAGLLSWFVKRNVLVVMPRFALVALLIYLCAGGSTTVMQLLIGSFEKTARNNGVASKDAYKKPAADAPHEVVKPLPVPAETKKELPPQSIAPIAQPAPISAPAPVSHMLQPVRGSLAEIVAPVETSKQRKIVLLGRDRLCLDNGHVVRVGETIGRVKLRSINWPQRECTFSDERTVRLGEVLNAE